MEIQSKKNYLNDSIIRDNVQVGVLLKEAKNNTIYDTYLYSNKYGVSFTRGSTNNILNDLDFSEGNDEYDIHHGYDSNSEINGWNNVLIDTEFEDISIDSDSRLLVKTLVQTTIKDNGTYQWNRVNTTLDSDRKASSGTNSFWAGDAEEDEYGNSWTSSFKMKSAVTLPDGDIGESSILSIRTWYKTEERFDGGRVYISKDLSLIHI